MRRLWRAGVRPLLPIGCRQGVAQRVPPLQPVSLRAAGTPLAVLEGREHLLPAGLLQVWFCFLPVSLKLRFSADVKPPDLSSCQDVWRRSVRSLLPADPRFRFGHEVWRADLPSSLLLLPGRR